MALKDGLKVAGETLFSIDDNGATAADFDRWNGGTEISIGGSNSWAAQDVNLYDYSGQQPEEGHMGEMWIIMNVWIATAGSYVFHSPGVQLQMRPDSETYTIVPSAYQATAGFRFWVHIEACRCQLSGRPLQLIKTYSMKSGTTSLDNDGILHHKTIITQGTDYSSSSQGPRIKFPTWSGGSTFGVKIFSYWR